ncbi:MAG: hypothetical protein RDV41_12100 [Planctomycetota bacterium]|nr:hypothetical protein [Planctomycetota bacterium]
MLNVVMDTGVIISAYLWWGQSRQCLDGARAGGYTLGCSSEIESELRAVLASSRFALSHDEIDTTLVDLHAIAQFSDAPVMTEGDVAAPVPFASAALACAARTGAQFVVSGDARLIALKKSGRARVISPGELMFRLERERTRRLAADERRAAKAGDDGDGGESDEQDPA